MPRPTPTPTDLIVDAVGWITGSTERASGAVPDLWCWFCETFDVRGVVERTGDLDPVLWVCRGVGDESWCADQ